MAERQFSYYVLVNFVKSRDPSACLSVEHACWENMRALVLLTFIVNVKKRRYLKIYPLEFDEICQNCYQVSNFNH